MPEHQQIQQSKKTNTTFQKQATPAVQTPVSNPYSIIQRAKINPKSLTHADIMQLQRTIGNQAVGRLLTSIGSSSITQQATVQRQETPEEEEPLQGKFESIQKQEIPEEEEPLQGKMIEPLQRQEIPEEEKPLQGKFENKPEIACTSCFAAPIPIVQKQEIPEEEEPLQGKMIETVQRQEIPEEEEPLQPKRENNTGMPDTLKAGVENLSGIDMSDVRVHYNSDKPAKIGALAYTQGSDIHVAPGRERHLPHEAWHVVQQAKGRVKPTIQMKDGVPVNDDEELEQEADVKGREAVRIEGEKDTRYRVDTTVCMQMRKAISRRGKRRTYKLPTLVSNHIFTNQDNGIGFHSIARDPLLVEHVQQIDRKDRNNQAYKANHLDGRRRVVGHDKSMFPDSWNEQEVVDTIEQAFTNANIPAATKVRINQQGVTEQANRPLPNPATGRANGIRIGGITQGGVLQTAYPIVH